MNIILKCKCMHMYLYILNKVVRFKVSARYKKTRHFPMMFDVKLSTSVLGYLVLERKSIKTKFAHSRNKLAHFIYKTFVESLFLYSQ